MQMPCGGVVNDYVPFYFSPITAMAYSIHRGNVDLRAPNGTVLRTATMDERVFFVINVSKFAASTLTSYFSNIACNSLAPLPAYESDLAKLETHIAWELFDEFPKVAHIPQIGYEGVTKYFHNRDEPKYQTRSSKRMAEFLVKDFVPLSMIDCIITKTAAMKNTIEEMMKKSKWNIPVYDVSGCYF